MREIEFKFWNIKEKKWVNNIGDFPNSINDFFDFYKDEIIFCEFITKDINKVNIYRTDIITDFTDKYIVEWDNVQGCYYGKGINTANRYLIPFRYCKKIGNFFENPELMEEIK